MVYMFVDGFVMPENDQRNAMNLMDAAMKQAFKGKLVMADKLMDKALDRMQSALARGDAEAFNLIQLHGLVMDACRPVHPKEYLVN